MDSQTKAEIVVLIAHYNDNERLKNAINSIVEPFPVDVLIVDDGSKIKPDIQELRTIYGDRGFLDVKYNPENRGTSKTRNLGIETILQYDYKYIGVIDSDDTNKPNRFLKQLDYLKKNNKIGLFGAWGDYYSEDGNFLFTLKNPISDKEIRKKMYLNSMFVHSSVLLKREVLEIIGGYDNKYKKGAVDDYDLWFRIIKKYQVGNYPEALVNITVLPSSFSSKQRFSQVFNRIRVIVKHFYFGFYPIYGLVRNLILLIIPRGFGIKIRTWFKIGKLPI